MHSDIELVGQIAKGDETAFSSLFYTYKDRLYGFVFSLTRSSAQAEDIVQDVFLKIWQNRAQLEDVENISAYIFKMVRNYAIDKLRRLAKEIEIREILIAEDTHLHTPEKELLRKEQRELIQKALEKLPSQQRKIYSMHRLQGMKFDEIAQELGLSISTVKNHIFRASENIRTDLSSYYSQIGVFLLIMMVDQSLFQ